jgi:hypothetical protein
MESSGLYSVNLLVVAGVALVAILGSAEAGRMLGTRIRPHATEAAGKRVELFEGALLGLLSLMIGFTFSLALNRFEQHKAVVLAEANAIGTVALRARLLSAPHAATVTRLAKAYAQQRLTLGAALYGSPERAGAIRESLRLQDSLWTEATVASALDAHSVPAGLFTRAVNDLIDVHESRVTADRNHVPQAVLVLLYGIAIVAMGFAGYVGGVAGARNRVPVLLMTLTVVMVITLVMDLDRPRRGMVTVSQQPMLDLIAGM